MKNLFCILRLKFHTRSDISVYHLSIVILFPRSLSLIRILRCSWHQTDCGRHDNAHCVYAQVELVLAKMHLLMHVENLSWLMCKGLGLAAEGWSRQKLAGARQKLEQEKTGMIACEHQAPSGKMATNSWQKSPWWSLKRCVLPTPRVRIDFAVEDSCSIDGQVCYV